MFVRTGPPRRIVSPVRSPETIVPSSLSSHQSPLKAAHRRQALVAIAEAHESAGADEAGDLAVELLVPQRDLGRRPPDQQPHRVYRSGQDCSPHAAEHDAADGAALALLDELESRPGLSHARKGAAVGSRKRAARAIRAKLAGVVLMR